MKIAQFNGKKGEGQLRFDLISIWGSGMFDLLSLQRNTFRSTDGKLVCLDMCVTICNFSLICEYTLNQTPTKKAKETENATTD